MENKSKRFLSLLLALVMVIALMPLGYANAAVAANTPVLNNVEGALESGTYVLVSANQLYRANGGIKAVSTAVNTDGKLPAATVALTDVSDEYVWTLEIGEGSIESGYTAKIKTADGKFMAYDGTKVTLTDTDTSVTIVPGNAAEHGPNGTSTDKYTEANFVYTWGINFGSTYLNYGNLVGNWTFDCGSHWVFYKIDSSDPFIKANWTKIYVDTETPKENDNSTEGVFEQAWDDNTNTKWHSNWNSNAGTIGKLTAHGENNAFDTIGGAINFGAEAYINQFSFLPRQDDTGHTNGDGVVTIASLYKGTLNEDGTYSWAPLAEHVEFPHNQELKTFTFEAQNVQYVKFVAEKSVNDGWVVVSEFYIDYVAPTVIELELPGEYAHPMMDSTREENVAVALSDCEYTLSAGSEENKWSLSNNGIYVKPAANTNGIPQQTESFDALTLEFQDNGKVRIGGNGYIHVHNAGANDTDTDDHPYWDKCSTAHGDQANGTDEFYLLKKTADGNGYEVAQSAEAGESYLIAFSNAAGEWFVMYPSTETVSLAKIVEIYIDLASMTMANSLDMNFAFEMSNVADTTGYYAVIEKDNADGETETQRVESADWLTTDIDGDGAADHYYVTFNGIAAKEMTDEIRVTIYNGDGVAVSNVHTDSVKDQAMRNLALTDVTDLTKTMVVDMLNYGALAQTKLGYKTDALATSELTDDQKAFGTQDITLENAHTNENYFANVKMLSNIQFMMAFSNVEEATNAVVTYTKHTGDAKTFNITPVKDANGFYVVTIEETVIADGRQEIACVLYDGETQVATATDSMASYAARAAESNSDNADLYKAIMKFSDSAKAKLAE